MRTKMALHASKGGRNVGNHLPIDLDRYLYLTVTANFVTRKIEESYTDQIELNKLLNKTIPDVALVCYQKVNRTDLRPSSGWFFPER